MAIPTTSLHILRVMLQAEQNLSGLQRDIRNNAISWRASAQAQNLPIETLAQYMNDAASEYQKRLAWVDALQAKTSAWNKMSTMWAALGGTGKDFSDIVTPMDAVATQLAAVGKASYDEIIAICDQIIAAINAPLSLWPE